MDPAPKPSANELFRDAMRKARDVQARRAAKPSRAQGSVNGGTIRSDILDTDADGLPLDDDDTQPNLRTVGKRR